VAAGGEDHTGHGTESVSTTPTAGPHTIEASVTDSVGRSATDQIALTVTSAGCPAHFDVDPVMVTGPDTGRAVNTIDILSGVSVESTGDLHLIASQSVSFEHAVAVQPGGLRD
jgi:hypothetical protein